MTTALTVINKSLDDFCCSAWAQTVSRTVRTDVFQMKIKNEIMCTYVLYIYLFQNCIARTSKTDFSRFYEVCNRLKCDQR